MILLLSAIVCLQVVTIYRLISQVEALKEELKRKEK